MKIKVKVSGTAPLIMGRFNYDPEGSKKKKQVYVPEEEAKKRAYLDEHGKPYLPSTNFKAAMIKSGSDFPFKGRKTYKEYLKAGIFFESDKAYITPDKYTIHEEPVKIQSAMVMSWRPKFEKWSTEFIIQVIDEELNHHALKEILEDAGKFKAVGSHRPEYGRFQVDSFKVIE